MAVEGPGSIANLRHCPKKPPTKTKQKPTKQGIKVAVRVKYWTNESIGEWAVSSHLKYEVKKALNKGEMFKMPYSDDLPAA